MESISKEYGLDQAATGPAQSEPVVSVRGLVKRYGSHEAVAGIDLEVRRGEIFAFLGPNGAGKTTTVEILEGFGQRTEGQVSVLGHDPATAGGAWRDRVGVVLQESEPEPGLSVRECLAMYAGLYRAPRDIEETIALVGLTEKFGQRFRAAFLPRRRDALAVILHRAQARGELPPHLPPATITDIVFGVIWYRLLATRQHLDDRLANELVATLAGAPPSVAPSAAPAGKETA